MAEQEIRAIIIIEIAGRPPEHVKQSLETHTATLKKVKGVEVINEQISEPKKLEKGNEVYTCFSEIEIKCESFSKLIDIIFDFMPSSIEIIQPSSINFNMQQATSFINTLAGRLHRYDEIAKIAQLQNQQLASKIKELQEKNPEEKKEEKTSEDKKSDKKNN